LISISCNKNKKIEKNEVKKELIKLPPPPKRIDKNSLVGFACGYSGESSETVNVITEILENKKYAELKNKIISNKPAEKYLATFSCIKLFEKGIIKLDENELNQIEKNKRSNLKIYFCGGCTYNENYKMSQLFSEETEFNLELENWFKQIK